MTPGERHAIRDSVREAIARARDLARCSAAAQAIGAELASPLTTSAAGHMPNAGGPGCWPADATLAVIRDLTPARQRGDLTDPARAAAERARGGQPLLNSVVSIFLNVGLSLQAAIDQSDGAAARHITEALSRLDPRCRRCRTDQRAGHGGSRDAVAPARAAAAASRRGPLEREPPSMTAARANQGMHHG
jgi:hypothetical protein